MDAGVVTRVDDDVGKLIRALVCGLQARAMHQVRDRAIDLLPGCVFGGRAGDQENVPAGSDAGQTTAYALSEHAADPVANDGTAQLAADRKCKATLWPLVGVLDQDQPTVVPRSPTLLQVPDLRAAFQPVLLSKHCLSAMWRIEDGADLLYKLSPIAISYRDLAPLTIR